MGTIWNVLYNKMDHCVHAPSQWRHYYIVTLSLIGWVCTQQGKSEGFDSCNQPSNLKLDSNCRSFSLRDLEIWWMASNKANLRDLIAATGLVILLKLDSNHWFFSHVTLKFDWWPRKIIGHLFNGWPWKTIGILFYVTLSFVHHFKAFGEFKLKLQSRNAQFGPKWEIFSPVWP